MSDAFRTARSPPVTQDANKRRRRRFHSSTDESFVMHRDRIGATYSRRPILKRDNAGWRQRVGTYYTGKQWDTFSDLGVADMKSCTIMEMSNTKSH